VSHKPISFQRGSTALPLKHFSAPSDSDNVKIDQKYFPFTLTKHSGVSCITQLGYIFSGYWGTLSQEIKRLSSSNFPPYPFSTTVQEYFQNDFPLFYLCLSRGAEAAVSSGNACVFHPCGNFFQSRAGHQSPRLTNSVPLLPPFRQALGHYIANTT